MKDDIRNIINLESISRMRSSISLNAQIPSRDSIVKLIPLEYLEHGLKVLIDGKLFIAFIEGNITLKEEIIAVVTNSSPFSLSMHLLPLLKNDETLLINQVLKKFKLPRKQSFKKIIPKIIQEDKHLIKSKIVQLEEILNYFKADGIQFSLLVDLIWRNTKFSKDMIYDLYENLFNESFEVVCSNLFDSIKMLLFAELPQFLVQKINNELIYYPESINQKPLLNKIEAFSELIKQFNGDTLSYPKSLKQTINTFIHYGLKYILQKSVLKDYDYFPDFVAVKTDSELILVQYSIKRVFNSKDQAVHKVIFKNESLPFNLNGIIRNNFLEGHLNTDDSLKSGEFTKTFEQNLFSHWGFRSEIKISKHNKDEYFISKINTKVNKLVS